EGGDDGIIAGVRLSLQHAQQNSLQMFDRLAVEGVDQPFPAAEMMQDGGMGNPGGPGHGLQPQPSRTAGRHAGLRGFQNHAARFLRGSTYPLVLAAGITARQKSSPNY